jgi:hypothetical protein
VSFLSKSIRNKRKLVEVLVDKNKFKKYDQVKYSISEGALLTVIGKISYDVTKDEF